MFIGTWHNKNSTQHFLRAYLKKLKQKALITFCSKQFDSCSVLIIQFKELVVTIAKNIWL